MSKIFYACDPTKNTICKKVECIKDGGKCSLTSRAEFAVNPDVVTLVFDVTDEDAKMLMQGDDS